MDAQPNETIFEITVTQEGSVRIMRLYRTVKTLFGISIVMSVIFQAASFYRLLFYLKIYDTGSWISRTETIAYPIYTLLYSILLVGQIYCFFHFTRLCRKSIELGNADLFNHSFKWLTRSAAFSLVTFGIELLMAVFSFYATAIYLNSMPAS
jgi:hypothetical protein